MLHDAYNTDARQSTHQGSVVVLRVFDTAIEGYLRWHLQVDVCLHVPQLHLLGASIRDAADDRPVRVGDVTLEVLC